MSLDTINAEGIEQGLQRWAANPGPEPEAGFSVTSFLGSGLKGFPSAALESAGSVADVLSGFGTAAAASGGSAGGMFSVPTEQEQKQEAQARDRMLKGDAFDTGAGNVLRAKAQEFAPDPQTAHKADQVMHGLVRFGAKAVTAVGTMGPAGAILLGLDEGNTVTQNLRAEGVDTGTATKVGAVQGTIAAASVVLPLGGKTLAQTIGLVGVGGPGSYMAQEHFSRKILEEAGYLDQASLHNPFDPLGLALSTIIPGGFGAMHMRSVRRTALERIVEHIESGGQRFGPDGKLITSDKGAQGEMQVMPGTARDPGYGVTPAKDGSPDELARVGRDYLAAMQQRYGETDKALAAYNAGPGAVDAAIKKHGGEWLKHMPSETREYVHKAFALGARHVAEVAAQHPEAVDAARVATTNEALVRSLPDTPDAVAQVMRASDIVAERGGRAAEQEVPPAIDFEAELGALRTEIASQSQEVARLQAEAALPPSARTITNKAGDLFYDTRGGAERFHGSSNELSSLSDDYALSGDNRNIYGQGFYTTDAADISNGYMKKGRGGSPALYKVREKNAPNLFDMEEPLQAGLKAKAEEIFGALYRDTDVHGKDIESLRELYDEVRAESQGEGYSRNDVQEMFDSMRHYLEEAGYDGFTHVGGKQTGNRAHGVSIYWTPEKHIDIEKGDIGAYRAPQTDAVALAQAVERANDASRRYVELKAQRDAYQQTRTNEADNTLPSPDSITVAGDEPAQRGTEVGQQPEAAAKPAEEAKPPRDAATVARDLELVEKRRTTLQTLLECLEAA